MWGDRDIRKEQLRVAVAIAAIALAFYVRELPFPTNSLYGYLSLMLTLLTLPWGTYLLLIAVAAADDLDAFTPPERLCRESKRIAHSAYYMGVASILAMILLLVFLLVYPPTASS
jgi:hypothetical protein